MLMTSCMPFFRIYAQNNAACRMDVCRSFIKIMLFSHIYENVLICAENIRSALMRSAVRLLRGRFRTDLADGGHARS